MTEPHISPEKVTKPIQLLAAWLVGLIVVNASFLVGAQQISTPAWASGLLVISAVLNVPIFIIALFLLQTRFRPQMQEDSYYAQYLKSEREYGQQKTPDIKAAEAAEEAISKAAEKITKRLGDSAKGQEQPIANILRESQLESLVNRFGGTRSLAELYLSPSTWPALVNIWGKSESFVQEVELLIAEGLAAKKFKGYLSCSLTDLGRQVAKIAENREALWSQKQPEYWKEDRERLAPNA